MGFEGEEFQRGDSATKGRDQRQPIASGNEAAVGFAKRRSSSAVGSKT